MLPILVIGPLSIQTAGLAWLLALWLGLLAAERSLPPPTGEMRAPTADDLYALAWTGLLVALVSARGLYVLRYWEAFATQPFSVLALDPGLLDPWGGIGGILLGVEAVRQRRQLGFWLTLDALTPVLAGLTLGAATASLLAGTAYGVPTDLPWAIRLWGELRHPVQVYDLLLSLGALLLVWPGSGPVLRRWASAPPGSRFCVWLAAFAAAQLLIDAWRATSPTLLTTGLRLPQLLAWIALALALWGLHHRLSSPTHTT
jgi:phosphatidylglycerol:prolipoprotein diacylglycerol transferase